MRSKLGLASDDKDDMELMNSLLASLEGQQVDYTQFFRKLIHYLEGNEDVIKLFQDSSDFRQWLLRWRDRLNQDKFTSEQSVQLMKETNPVYIARNHKVEEALELAVNEQDFSLFEKLNSVLSDPYVEKEGLHEYRLPAPKEFGFYKTFCGT